MDSTCRKYWHLGMPCASGHSHLLTGDTAVPATAASHANPCSIIFGADRPESAAPITGYNALAPHLKTVRDPALSLIALSGIEPTEPVMVEVPLVLNNTTFTESQTLSGWRIGFAERYVRGDQVTTVEHAAVFIHALEVFRHAGAQLVPVNARRGDEAFQFDLQTHNEIDELVSTHRLDALVSDSRSVAFHNACRSGYPSLCEALEEGTKLWMYGARWSRDALPTLLEVYRKARTSAPLQGVLNALTQ
ncbi:hypothetical protein PSH62_22060 [Pseudomonas tolaasii]|nr:hypothetical protein [Pseudomonas tolaasii]WLH50746.1 hypothetical protein PSH62_22060 [Pseudomonas tolaasii]